MLSERELKAFDKKGFCGPFNLDNPLIIDSLLSSIVKKQEFNPISGNLKKRQILGKYKEHPLGLSSTHLTIPEAMAVAKDTAIINRLQQLMDTIYLRHSQVWRKLSKSRPVVWHQDTHRKQGIGYVGEISAWIALEDAHIDSGCVWFLEGSHKDGIVPPSNVVTPDFALNFFKSDEILTPPALTQYKAVPMSLKKGQFFLFHQLCFHASGPNKTDTTRTGLAYRYLEDASLIHHQQLVKIK